MKYSPNCITFTRIILSTVLLFFEPFSILFYILFLLCGITDILDGFLARKIKAESIFGEQLDSIADIFFFVVSAIKVLSVFALNRVIIIWSVIIAILKVANIVINSRHKKRFSINHLRTNKITGLLLFLLPLWLGFANSYLSEISEFIRNINILAIPVCVMASYSLVDEWKFQK